MEVVLEKTYSLSGGDFFKKNPRTSMMVHTFNKMSDEKKETHLGNAEGFLKKLDKG